MEKIFPQYNLRLVNLSALIKEQIDISIVNDLHNYGLLSNKHLSGDVKKLIYHHLFMGICNAVTSTWQEKCVFFFNPEECKPLELFNYFSEEQIRKEINHVVARITRLFPIKVFYSGSLFTTTISHIIEKNGEGKGIVNELQVLLSSYDTGFTFRNAIKFARQHQLQMFSQFLHSPAKYAIALS